MRELEDGTQSLSPRQIEKKLARAEKHFTKLEKKTEKLNAKYGPRLEELEAQLDVALTAIENLCDTAEQFLQQECAVRGMTMEEMEANNDKELEEEISKKWQEQHAEEIGAAEKSCDELSDIFKESTKILEKYLKVMEDMTDILEEDLMPAMMGAAKMN